MNENKKILVWCAQDAPLEMCSETREQVRAARMDPGYTIITNFALEPLLIDPGSIVYGEDLSMEYLGYVREELDKAWVDKDYIAVVPCGLRAHRLVEGELISADNTSAEQLEYLRSEVDKAHDDPGYNPVVPFHIVFTPFPWPSTPVEDTVEVPVNPGLTAGRARVTIEMLDKDSNGETPAPLVLEFTEAHLNQTRPITFERNPDRTVARVIAGKITTVLTGITEAPVAAVAAPLA